MNTERVIGLRRRRRGRFAPSPSPALEPERRRRPVNDMLVMRQDFIHPPIIHHLAATGAAVGLASDLLHFADGRLRFFRHGVMKMG